MDFLSLLIISTSLTFDTLAVSITTGLTLRNIQFWQATRLAFVMAIIQGAMPLLGWFIGSQSKQFIAGYDHWVAFILLSMLGAKMIYEAFKQDEEKKEVNPLKIMVLIGISIATSIDALVAGFSFGLLQVNITLAIVIIVSLTYLMAMLGMLFGKKAGSIVGKKIEILAGFILIAIGTKILLFDTIYAT